MATNGIPGDNRRHGVVNNALKFLTLKQNNGLKETQIQENLWMLNRKANLLRG